MSRQTFERLEHLALLTLEAGFAVIVDATFLHRRTRDSFRLLAKRLALPFVIIECSAPAEELRRRLQLRQQQGHDASEADVKVMEEQLKVDQPPARVELAHCMQAASGEEPAVLWQHLQGALRHE